MERTIEEQYNELCLAKATEITGWEEKEIILRETTVIGGIVIYVTFEHRTLGYRGKYDRDDSLPVQLKVGYVS